MKIQIICQAGIINGLDAFTVSHINCHRKNVAIMAKKESDFLETKEGFSRWSSKSYKSQLQVFKASLAPPSLMEGTDCT